MLWEALEIGKNISGFLLGEREVAEAQEEVIYGSGGYQPPKRLSGLIHSAIVYL